MLGQDKSSNQDKIRINVGLTKCEVYGLRNLIARKITVKTSNRHHQRQMGTYDLCSRIKKNSSLSAM